jgi:hypothetical protein
MRSCPAVPKRQSVSACSATPRSPAITARSPVLAPLFFRFLLVMTLLTDLLPLTRLGRRPRTVLKTCMTSRATCNGDLYILWRNPPLLFSISVADLYHATLKG